MTWKKAFLEQYTSEDLSAHAKSLSLKQKHLPKKLYRYRPLNNFEHIKKEIVEGKVYFPHPSVLNDPLDAKSLLGNRSAGAYIKNKEVFSTAFEEIMSSEEHEIVFKADDWHEKLTLWVAERTTSGKSTGELVSCLNKASMSGIEDFNNQINELIYNMYRYVCFTENNLNSPMWAHYADGHKGICIEYDIEEIKNVFVLNRLFPVIYVKNLPDAVKLQVEKKIAKHAFFDYILIHKLKSWEYEQEWRLIFDMSLWYPDGNVPKHCLREGKEGFFCKPSKIFLGKDIETSSEEKIREYAGIINIPVSKMTYTEYGMESE